MIPAADRAKSTLRAVIAFAKERDRWPDLDELRAYTRRNLGSRSTVLRTLQSLRDNGCLELRGRTPDSNSSAGRSSPPQWSAKPSASTLRSSSLRPTVGAQRAIQLALAFALRSSSQFTADATAERLTSQPPPKSSLRERPSFGKASAVLCSRRFVYARITRAERGAISP